MPRLAPGTRVIHRSLPKLGVGIVQNLNIEDVRPEKQENAKNLYAMVLWPDYPHLTKPRSYMIEDLDVVPSNNANQEGGRRKRKTRRNRKTRQKRRTQTRGKK